MKIGVMQPYLFPYIGYWQLMNAVDKYVIYDDVNFIKGGWINRNRILINGEGKMINLQLHNASQNKLINEVEVFGEQNSVEKLIKTIERSYCKAPYFEDVFPIIKMILSNDEKNLAKYLEFSIRKVCEYLSIDTEIIVSSKIAKNNELKGQDKIIAICKALNGNEYYNAIGGQELYNYQDFVDNNLKLSFLETDNITYKQFNNEFVSNLSIIDVMMFNSQDEIKKLLLSYKCI